VARKSGRRILWLIVLLALAGFATWGLAVHTPPGPRSARAFDPDRLADLEVEMWQAYYARENAALLRALVVTLREQFRYPWSKATRAAVYLARAASTFGKAQADYERVLPDLERAYTISRDWTGAGFDPAAVARAELAWWVARRDPAQRDPENVGRLITDLYARFYEVPHARVAEAGLLRARAAALRDRGGVNPDWPEINRLLHASYRALYEGLKSGSGPQAPGSSPEGAAGNSSAKSNSDSDSI